MVSTRGKITSEREDENSSNEIVMLLEMHRDFTEFKKRSA